MLGRFKSNNTSTVTTGDDISTESGYFNMPNVKAGTQYFVRDRHDGYSRVAVKAMTPNRVFMVVSEVVYVDATLAVDEKLPMLVSSSDYWYSSDNPNGKTAPDVAQTTVVAKMESLPKIPIENLNLREWYIAGVRRETSPDDDAVFFNRMAYVRVLELTPSVAVIGRILSEPYSGMKLRCALVGDDRESINVVSREEFDDVYHVCVSTAFLGDHLTLPA